MTIFLNAPIQNGDFTFAEKPGKRVGIQIAQALNTLQGTYPTPHLWNTVMLAGDKRYRQQQATNHTRHTFEAALIASKYAPATPRIDHLIVTDADTAVQDFALTHIQRQLSSGHLGITSIDTYSCHACDHLVGSAAASACGACGHTKFRQQRTRELVATCNKDIPLLPADAVYGRANIRHLSAIAAHVPDRLILSRTRDHGIDLSPIGLPGRVLDPRAGLHLTCLATAQRTGASQVVMTLSMKAAAHIIAYGQFFRTSNDLDLAYGLHGHLPLEAAGKGSGQYCDDPEAANMFSNYFLPLLALRHKQGFPGSQLPALAKFFTKSWAHSYTIQPPLVDISAHIQAGHTAWLMDKRLLAIALSHMRASQNIY